MTVSKIVVFIGFMLMSHYLLLTSYGLPEVQINTTKTVYNYGQVLSLAIKVTELTANKASVTIGGPENFQPIVLPATIIHHYENLTAPSAFYKTVFPPGKYYVRLEYAGSNATALFELKDSSNIAIPLQYKYDAYAWLTGEVPKKYFATDMIKLVHSGIIEIKNFEPSSSVVIPVWFKHMTSWWINGTVSDNDYGHALQYLIKENVVRP